MKNTYVHIGFQIDTIKKKIAALKNGTDAKVDTIKKKIALPKGTINPGDLSKKKPGILKRLADALKFKTNFRAKEKARIIEIINSLEFHNPAIATAQNVSDLKKELTDTTRKQYEELSALIKQIQDKQLHPDVTPIDTSAIEAQNQKTLNDLMVKILPILRSVTNDHSLNPDRQKRVQKIRALYGRPPNQLDTLKLNDTSSLVYKIKLTHKAQVIGYDVCSSANNNYLNYNYKALTGIAVHCYVLNTSDGYCHKLDSKTTDDLVQNAKANDDNIYISIYANTGNVTSFLNSPTAQSNCIQSIVKFLREQTVKGINLSFGTIGNNSRLQFSGFIKNLSKAITSKDTPVELNVMLPVTSSSSSYDLKELNNYVTYFIIDFSKATSTKGGPLAPLSGSGINLQSAISRYLNKGILPGRFLICLSYEGIKWSYTKGSIKGSNSGYISYSSIRANYPYSFYNPDSSIVYAAKTSENGNSDTVWYDDENTLAKKYDYILRNKLGGIAIWKLGDDDGHGELWDAITDKFISVETIKVEELNYAVHPANLSLSQLIDVYYFPFRKPCDRIFPAAICKMLNINPRDTVANVKRFNYVVGRSEHFLIIVNIVLLILLLVSCIILVHYLRIEGEWWPYRKPLIGIIITIVVIGVLTGSASLYLSDSIPWFGASSGENCIEMPFHVLISIIAICISAGMLLMNFLVTPFLKKEDTP